MEINRGNFYNLLHPAQYDFVEYVLRNYVDFGVDELDVNKLSAVLTVNLWKHTCNSSKIGHTTRYSADIHRVSETLV